MHRIVPAVVALALTACAPSLASAPGGWLTVSAPPTTMSEPVMVGLADGDVLVAGGQDSQGKALADAFLFDPRSETWHRLPNLPEPRQLAMAALLHDGRVLVVGGYGTTGPLASSVLFDPRRAAWVPAGFMTGARGRGGIAVLGDGRVLVAGGSLVPFQDYGVEPSVLTVTEVFDPRSGSWSTTGTLHQARIQPAVTVLADGKVLAAGGSDGTNPIPSAEIYDPRSESWSTTSSMPQPRAGATAMRESSGRIVLIGGSTFNGLGSFNANPGLDTETFDPGSQAWSVGSEAELSNRFALFQGASQLSDGRILALIVYLGSVPETLALTYDPSADFWARAPRPALLDQTPTTVRLSTGRVLVLAGPKALIYDPSIAAPAQAARGAFDSTETTLVLGAVLFIVMLVILGQRWRGGVAIKRA
jgi:hypothetical protein